MFADPSRLVHRIWNASLWLTKLLAATLLVASAIAIRCRVEATPWTETGEEGFYWAHGNATGLGLTAMVPFV